MEVIVRKAPPLNIYLVDDYAIQNHLEVFESHMFLTTERAVQSQLYIPNVSFSVGLAENKSMNTNYDACTTRQEALKKFNTCLYNHLGRRPNRGDVGCFLGTFQADVEDEDDVGFYILAYLRLRPRLFVDWARQLAGFVVEFSARTRRAAAVTPHFFQNKRYPHFHFLYEKKDGTDDENLLQRYLYDKLNKVGKFNIK